MLKHALATLAMALAVGAWSLAWGAAPVLAAGCSSTSHSMTLTTGTASPGSGTAGDSFTFSVTYTDNKGCAPTAIAVSVGGVGVTALQSTSTSYKTGAVFTGAMTLPAGTWTYSFTAASGTGSGAQTVTLSDVSPAAIVVAAPPPPPPSPTPTPTPTPTPKPTPTPAPKPTPTPTPKPTPKPTPTPTPASTAAPTPTPSPPAAPSSSASGGSRSPSAGPSATPVAAGIVAFDGGDGGWRAGGGTASIGGLPEGGGGGGWPLATILASAVFSLGGVALFMALMALARRRQVTVPVLEAAPTEPAMGFSYLETRGLALPPPPPDAPPEEAGIPRWRRPSLRAARQLSERDVPMEHVPILFVSPADPGIDRRQVAYRLVRMGTEPDEFAGTEVGRLDRGDEVEVLSEQAGYCLVRTPLGAVGWVHRTTLRELDEEPSFELHLESDA